jgi:hypothetical protein
MDSRSIFCLIIFTALSSLLSLSAQNSDRYIYRSGDLVIISDAERIEGIVYKVEVARLPFIDPNDPELKRLESYGALTTESIQNKGQKALMIGDFQDKEEARKVRDQLRQNGFTSAQVITYKNGLRQA